jgi:(p)ppGpp synthase/HD superfamily hydrolase
MENNNDMVAMARKYAEVYHAGQVDKGGNQYILHPMAVADGVQSPLAKAVAWLHDVLEDRDDVSRDDLIRAGFSEDVVSRVELLTHLPHERYDDYIRRLRVDPIAREVKRSDLRSNMDLSRMHGRHDGVDRRMKKYRNALILLDEMDE